jgi:hypothetical protein
MLLAAAPLPAPTPPPLLWGGDNDNGQILPPPALPPLFWEPPRRRGEDGGQGGGEMLMPAAVGEGFVPQRLRPRPGGRLRRNTAPGAVQVDGEGFAVV